LNLSNIDYETNTIIKKILIKKNLTDNPPERQSSSTLREL